MREASRRNPLNDGPETAHQFPLVTSSESGEVVETFNFFFLGGEPAQGWNLQRDACHGRKGTLEALPTRTWPRIRRAHSFQAPSRQLIAGSSGAGTR